jgi:2-oxoisovalerate dehydrogenase E2 component (dihydrolipoyl transacylase)
VGDRIRGGVPFVAGSSSLVGHDAVSIASSSFLDLRRNSRRHGHWQIGVLTLMARFEFRLPDIGEGIAEAEIVAWHVKVGDEIAEDQQIADMMTDKATVEMESPVGGKVLELAGEVGEQVPIGSVLAVIETDGADRASETAAGSQDERPLADGAVEATPAMAEAMPVTSPRPLAGRQEPRSSEGAGLSKSKAPTPTSPPPAPPASGRGEHVLASPAVRARARDLGIDLAEVKSKDGRVRHSDLDAYLLYNGGSVSSRGTAARQDETIKVVGLRRKIAENMAEAKRRIPHFTLVEEYDVSALEEARAMMNRDRASNPKLTLLPFLITAMVRALPDWPMLNATYDDEANVITRHGAVDMGMATQTPNGLMVPVIRNAQSLSVWQIASEILRLSDAARSGKAARDELMGSTITISSLGPMGGITSTPVINRPEVAILAVNKVEEKLVPINGKIEVRKRMNLSLSCDHRVVDGWDAANFMQALKAYIENPLRLLSA